ETVKEDGHRAEIERVRAEPDEMRRNALQLAHQNANRLRAFRNLEAEQFLAGHAVGEVVAERIEIVHPVGDHDALLILFVLEELFHAGVEIADVRRRLDHHFAVEHEFETQHAVRRRVLRPHRERHLRVERTIDDFELRRNGWCRTHAYQTSIANYFRL